MPFTQCLVSPKLPTVLATNEHVDLPGYDLWLLNVCFVPMNFPVFMPGPDQQRSCPADKTWCPQVWGGSLKNLAIIPTRCGTASM